MIEARLLLRGKDTGSVLDSKLNMPSIHYEQEVRLCLS